MTEPPDHRFALLPEAAETRVEVEVLPPEFVASQRARSVTLSGDAARDVRDSLGTAFVETGRVARHATDVSLRLVPSEKTSAGLADGSLRWATASKGDASVLIKDSASGRIAGQGELHKVRPYPAKVLGPAVWEAMAMATQQHYLVDINAKLQTIEAGVSEILASMDGDKRGTLAQVRRVVLSSRERLAEGHTLSEGRLRELRDGTHRADEVWHQLYDRMTRHLAEYRAGQATAEVVEGSWAMLLHATQVLGESSALLTSLPFDSVQALEDATPEERERVLHAVESVRGLAGELSVAHGHWAARNAEWRVSHTRNPARKAIRAARKTALPKPTATPLDFVTAWRVSQVAAPPQPPTALLLTVNEDGTVEMSAETWSHGLV